MKKILIFLALICFVVKVSGQASGSTITFLPNETIKTVTPLATDTVSGVLVKYWKFALNKPKLQYFSFATEFDTTLRSSRVGGNRVKLKIYGSLDNSVWVQVGSTIYYNANAGTNADSAFAVSDVSTGILWKYLKFEATGVTANKCTTIPKITLKVADK